MKDQIRSERKERVDQITADHGARTFAQTSTVRRLKFSLASRSGATSTSNNRTTGIVLGMIAFKDLKALDCAGTRGMYFLICFPTFVIVVYSETAPIFPAPHAAVMRATCCHQCRQRLLPSDQITPRFCTRPYQAMITANRNASVRNLTHSNHFPSNADQGFQPDQNCLLECLVTVELCRRLLTLCQRAR